MKKNHNLFLKIVLIIAFVLFLKLFVFDSFIQTKSFEDLIFYKFISNDNSVPKYYFKITCNDINIQSAELARKISPGSKGSFDLIIESNKNSFYQIIFSSKNKKPQNLRFKLLKDKEEIIDCESLEELSNYLQGVINGKKIIYTINWYWKYDSGFYLDDYQDTIDSKTIEKYNFDIYALGEEV